MLHPPGSTGEGTSPRCLETKRNRLDLVEADPVLPPPAPALLRLDLVLLRPAPVLPPPAQEGVERVLRQRGPVVRQGVRAAAQVDREEVRAAPGVAQEAAQAEREEVRAALVAPALVLLTVRLQPVDRAVPVPVGPAVRLRAEVPVLGPEVPAPLLVLVVVPEQAQAQAPQVLVVVPDLRPRELPAVLEVNLLAVPAVAVLGHHLVPAVAVLGLVTPVPIR